VQDPESHDLALMLGALQVTGDELTDVIQQGGAVGCIIC
jgi:hypothetical protein